jgi:hypothetical protein
VAPPPSFLLLSAAGRDSARNFEASVALPLDPGRVGAWVENAEAAAITNRITNRLGAWGLRDNTRNLPGASAKPLWWDRLATGTLALFSNHDEYFTQARVIGTAVSEQVSEELWGSAEFRWLVFLTDIEPVAIPLEVVRRGAGFSSLYNLNRQSLVPKPARDDDLWAAIAPFLDGDQPVSPPSEVVVTRIAPQAVLTETFEVARVAETREGHRREAALVSKLIDWWTKRDGPGAVCGLHIELPEGTGSLYVDLFNEITNELIEAKASCRRQDIRMAIGQMADYRRFLDPPPSCKVLLPEPPASDLLELLSSQEISVMVPDGDGFRELLP